MRANTDQHFRTFSYLFGVTWLKKYSTLDHYGGSFLARKPLGPQRQECKYPFCRPDHPYLCFCLPGVYEARVIRHFQIINQLLFEPQPVIGGGVTLSIWSKNGSRLMDFGQFFRIQGGLVPSSPPPCGGKNLRRGGGTNSHIAGFTPHSFSCPHIIHKRIFQ